MRPLNLGYGIFGGTGIQHMQKIAQMIYQDVAFFLPCQAVKSSPYPDVSAYITPCDDL
jgi:hypothetical protein